MTTIQLKIGHASANLDATTRIIIGRDEQRANLIANHPTVSRSHCEVYIEHGQAYLRDMGSSNGTWVNGSVVGQQPVVLAPGQQVFVGHVPLLVEWMGGAAQGATVMGEVPAELKAMIEARRNQAQVQYTTPAAAAPVAGSATETEAMTYRRQGSNNNGVLMIALAGDTFTNESVIKGFVEFTAMDAETINEIDLELVEIHKKGPRKGHVWDRVIVKKGPWKCKRNDRVPMPFELRVPSATSISSRDVHWEIRASVDIAWAFDVEVEVEINMRNQDIEKIRDAMGALDLRVDELTSKPLGQQFEASFEPPAQWRDQWNIDKVNLAINYLGTNIEITLEVDKRGVFSKDRRTKNVLELAALRATSLEQLSAQFQQLISGMLALK